MQDVSFYRSYASVDHMLPEYKHSITDPDTIVRNYKSLTPENKSLVRHK